STWRGPATSDIGPSLSTAGIVVRTTRPVASWMRSIASGSRTKSSHARGPASSCPPTLVVVTHARLCDGAVLDGWALDAVVVDAGDEVGVAGAALREERRLSATPSPTTARGTRPQPA